MTVARRTLGGVEPGDNGIRERLAEHDRRLGDAEDARRRLWEKANEQTTSLAVLRVELRGLGESLGAIRNDCAATREWVEEQNKERKAEEAEEHRLSLTQWAMVIGAVTAILSSLIAAFAGLASAGVI